jgi:hypothetical protein
MNRILRVKNAYSSFIFRQASFTPRLEKAKGNLKGKNREAARGKFYKAATNKQGREKEMLLAKANYDVTKMIKEGQYDKVMVSKDGAQTKKGLKYIKQAMLSDFQQAFDRPIWGSVTTRSPIDDNCHGVKAGGIAKRFAVG